MSSELYLVTEIRCGRSQIKLDCHRRKVTNILLPVQNVLRELICYQNFMINFPQLRNDCRYIDARENRMKVLEYFPQGLEYLNMSRNRLQSFNFMNLGENLRYLNLNHNFIKYIPQLPSNLETLIVCNNKLQGLPPLPNSLKVLKCCKNYIKELPRELPTNLEFLSCKGNYLSEIPDSIRECENLRDLKYEGNKNLVVSELILEFIDVVFQRRREWEAEQRRIREEERERLINMSRNARIPLHIPDVGENIYHDGQNVHDTTITADMRKSIENLFDCKLKIYCEARYRLGIAMKEFKSAIDKYGLNKGGKNDDYGQYNIYDTPDKMMEYLCKLPNKHSLLGYTFGEIFVRVWNRIHYYNNENEKDILTILVGDLPEMIQVCFTGRISRLVNSLSGFDKLVNIGISDGQQIQGKYHIIAKKLDRKYDTDSLIYNILFKYELRELLEEIEVKEEKIQEWVMLFGDEIKDILEKGEMENINKEMNLILVEVNKKYVIKFLDEYVDEKFLVKYESELTNKLSSEDEIKVLKKHIELLRELIEVKHEDKKNKI